MNISGVILAGGDSSRMGRDKAQLVKGKQTLVEMVRDCLKPHCDEILIVSRAERLEGLRMVRDVTLVADSQEGRGPLVGIQAGLQAAVNEHIFVAGCDMPNLKPATIQLILAADPVFDVVVPFLDDCYEPLHARYSRRCLPAVGRALAGARRSVPSFFKAVKVREITRAELVAVDPTLASFENLNTLQQWDDFNRGRD